MGKSGAAILIMLAAIVATIMVTQSARWKRTSGRNAFVAGRQAVCDGDYVAGRDLLQGYLADQSSGEYASRAQFFVAKSYVGEGDFAQARTAFQATIDRYPESLEAHKSAFKLAMLDLLQGDKPAALAGFRSLADRADGPFTPEATAMARWLETEPGGPSPISKATAD